MRGHAAVEQLSALIDDELDERELALVDRHLHVCPECRTRLEGLRAAAACLAELGSIPVPAPLARQRSHRLRLGDAGRIPGAARWATRKPDTAALPWWPMLGLLALVAVTGGLLVREHGTAAVERPLATVAALEGAPIAIVGDRIFRREGTVWREIENGEVPGGWRAATPAEVDSLLVGRPGLARLLEPGGSVEIVHGGERIRIAGR